MPDLTLADILMESYTDPRLGMDAADSDTRDVLSLMAAQQAAKDREPYEALTRLFTAAIPAGAAAHRALVGPAGNSWKAIERHIDLERRMKGNPLVNSATTPFLQAYLAAQPVVSALRGHPLPGFTSTGWRPGPMQGHADNTADILHRLNRTEPKTTTLY